MVLGMTDTIQGQHMSRGTNPACEALASQKWHDQFMPLAWAFVYLFEVPIPWISFSVE